MYIHIYVAFSGSFSLIGYYKILNIVVGPYCLSVLYITVCIC